MERFFEIKGISKVLKALSDPTRIKILVLLAQKESCVCELTATLGLAQPTVSRHLKQLEDEGFITSRREKNWIIYSLMPRGELQDALLGTLLPRAAKAKEMKELGKRLERLDRNTLSQSLR